VPRVSVILVNYNGERLLADCLNSLETQTFRDFEVVFVDNGSHDRSVAVARELCPGLKLVALPGNAGFAGGNNAGLRAAAGEYIVALNNDTRCDPHFLQELVRVADAYPEAGSVAPKILNFFERTRIDSVGGLLLGPDGIAIGRGRNTVDGGQFDGLGEILMPSGCAALYRRALLDAVGFFDDRFFAYCEDSDLGLRAIWAGWKAWSAPGAVVYHKYSASSGSYSAFKLRLVERNRLWLALRNFTPAMLLALGFYTGWRYALMAWALLRGSGKGQAAKSEGVAMLLWGFLRGMFEGMWGAPGILFGRPKRKISAGAFKALVRANRASQREIIFTA